MWLAVSNVLAVFDVLPPLDPVTGKELIPTVEFAGGLSKFVFLPFFFSG